MSKDNFNDEPVYYCNSCLSLKTKILEIEPGEFADYCGNCGGTNIEQTLIAHHEEIYYDMYGSNYIKGNKGLENGERPDECNI